MRAQGLTGDIKDYLRDMREDGVQALMTNGVQVYHATLGPGDLLVVPAGGVLAESVADHDCFGFKFHCIQTTDKFTNSFIESLCTKASTPAKAVPRLISEVMAKGFG